MRAANHRPGPAWSLDRYRLALARAHDLLLELLVKLVDAPEYRAGTAIADLLAVERDDRKNLLGGGSDPQLIGATRLRLGDFLEAKRHGIGARKLNDHVISNSRQDEIALRRRFDHAALHDEDVRRRSFSELSLTE